MSPDLPPPPPPPPPPPAPPSAQSAPRRGRVVPVAVGVGVLVVAATAVLVIGSRGPVIDHPEAWDARVLPLVEFVERERGLEFSHPVHVDFLTPEEYSAHMRVDADSLDDEERRALDDAVSILRALGLLSGEADLLAATNDLIDEGTLAVYSSEERRVRVRGTVIDVNLEVTLVHELVHALQDQHFDLGRLGTFETDGEEAAFRALVEGDASVVEQRYVQSLHSDERNRYLEGTAEQAAQFDVDDLPAILVAQFAAPYALGQPFVELLIAEEGWEAVDRFLDEPPTTELELLDPRQAIAGFTSEVVERPDVGEAFEVVEEGDFGALILYLTLAARIEPLDALSAADGWAGDAYVITTDPDGRVCVTVSTAAQSAEAHDRLERALSAWVESAPPATDAHLTDRGAVLELHSCDPGAEAADVSVTDGFTALGLAAVRSALHAVFAGEGMSPGQASCTVGDVLDAIGLDLVTNVEPTPGEVAELQELMMRSMIRCAGS